MLRVFDLSVDAEAAAKHLNDPHLRLLKCKVNASFETGYTTATLRMERVADPIERKRQRRLERYLLFYGINPILDERLRDPAVNLIKQFEFPTVSGVIIVIDFEIKEERS